MAKNDLKPTNPKDRAATSRLDLSLFPQTAIIYGALGMTEGDAKYGGYNYRVGGVLFSVYVAACLRHITKCYNGEWADPKTKVPHVASAIACLAIIVDANECGVLKDDRPPKANVGRLLDECEYLVGSLHKLFPNGPGRYTQKGVEDGLYLAPSKKIKSKKMSTVRGDWIGTKKTGKRPRRRRTS
jgi:hypothetical protein